MPKKKQSLPYTESFRREAVRRSGEEGIRIRIKPRGQFGKMKGEDYTEDASAELRKLRRKVAEQQEEIEFLKKATAYFAKEKK